MQYSSSVEEESADVSPIRMIKIQPSSKFKFLRHRTQNIITIQSVMLK